MHVHEWRKIADKDWSGNSDYDGGHEYWVQCACGMRCYAWLDPLGLTYLYSELIPAVRPGVQQVVWRRLIRWPGGGTQLLSLHPSKEAAEAAEAVNDANTDLVAIEPVVLKW